MWPFSRKREQGHLPSPEEVMRQTGMTEGELTRRFLEDLIQQGKNPFRDLPEHFVRNAEANFPDLLDLARRRFGGVVPRDAPQAETPQKVARNWDNLPSMVMTPVPRSFSYCDLARQVSSQAADKQLVCLVAWGWTASQEQAFQHIQELYSFADDPKLVLMRFLSPLPDGEQLIIRATFMYETAPHIHTTTLYELSERLTRLAVEHGFHTKTLE
jgi:hypothetical protein